MFRSRQHIAILALSSLLMTACSDETVQVSQNFGRIGPDGQAYMSLNLNVPYDQSGTRAVTFSDADEAEYKVKTATVMIFGCDPTKEQVPENMHFRTAKVIKWNYDGEGKPVKDEQDEHSAVNFSNRVTQTHSKVFSINGDNLVSNEKLYAYALVNDQPAKVADDGSAVYFGTASNGTYDYTFNASSTFRQLMDMPMRNLQSSDGFIMTNAPMATKGKDNYTSDAAIVYLPEFSADDIYPTEEEARTKGSAVSVSVERLAVKLTMTGNATMRANHLIVDDGIGYDYSGIRFCSDIRNTRSYNVRHVSSDYLGYEAGSKGRRFLDDTPTTTGLYRIFWGEDMNYAYQSATTSLDHFTFDLERGQMTSEAFDEAGIDGACYLHENTMNENGLVQGRTTRLYVRIPFVTGRDASNADVKGESFYTLSTENQDQIFLASGVATRDDGGNVTTENGLTTRQYAGDAPTEQSLVTKVDRTASGNDADKARLSVAEKIISIVGDMTEYQTWKASCSAETQGKADSEILVITMLNGVQDQPASSDLPTYGKAKALVSLNASVAEADKASFDAIVNDLDRALNDNVQFNYYDKGYAYYKVLVRHFDDDEVAEYVADQGSGYNNVYPEASRAKNYLGRYGMVRNTWYDITLTGVKHIGYPGDVPLSSDSPDDEVNNYLGVRVNVNKWAQRGQKNTL